MAAAGVFIVLFILAYVKLSTSSPVARSNPAEPTEMKETKVANKTGILSKTVAAQKL